MSTDPQTEAREYRKRIQDHRAALREAYGRNYAEKDKIVVTVSSAALGFTLAFLDPPSFALYLAWIAFALSVVAVLISFDLNARQLFRTLQRIDAWERDPRGQAEPVSGNYVLHFRKWVVRPVDLINTFSIYFLVIGICSTVVHVWRT